MHSIEESVIRRVACGADFLDKKFPGWEDGIDVLALDVASGGRCALAQTWLGSGGVEADALRAECGCCRKILMTAYEVAKDALGLRSQDCQALGFLAVDREYPLLTQAWRDEIVKRRIGSINKARAKEKSDMLASV